MLTLQDLEIRHLRALRAVAEEGTFGRAAERLGYTQSAISQQIAALEHIVGPVFDRPGGPRPVVLTPLGERVLGHGEAILDRLEAARADLSLFLAGRVGSISIGTFQSVSVQLLPGVLQRIRNDRPDLEVRLNESNDEDALISDLRSRRLDAAFLTRTNLGPDIEIIPLIEDPFVVVSPRDRGTVTVPGNTVHPAALHGTPLVCETLTTFQVLIEDGLRRLDVEPNVVFRTQDNAAVQAMARSGVGHAVMASLAVDTRDPGVVIRRLDPPLPPRRISVVLLRDREHPPALDLFVALTRAVSEQLVSESEWLSTPSPEP